MSAIKQVLSEALGVQQASTEITSTVTETESDHISRLRQLSGLANSTTVTGTAVDEAGSGIGLAYQRQLDQSLQEIEISIARLRGSFKKYAKLYASLEDHMSEEDAMHYGYGIRGMLDMLEDNVKELNKLG